MAVTPNVAVAADYESNPDLRSIDLRPETIGALLLSVPVTYDLDDYHAGVQPNARISSQKGYSSLGSNFVHLNTFGQYTSERDTVTLSAGLDRDTSLAHGGESDNGLGVRTDSLNSTADWHRLLTERAQVDVSLGWQRAQYDQGANRLGLVNYRYTSAAPNFAYAITEITKLTVSGGAGRYASDDGLTSSNNYDLQLGIERRLSEIWTLTASAGYAKSENSEKVFFGPYYLGTIDAQQKGGVYTASLVRRAEVLSLTASATRAYLPSGFGLLSQQTSFGLQAFYNYSERWAFAIQSGYHTTGYALASSNYSPLKYFSGDASANWNWTPEWTISLHASWVQERYQSAPSNPQSRGVSLQFTRQFYRVEL